jgi:hypothetical protein
MEYSGEELKKLKDKAEKSRQAHFSIARKQQKIRDILNYVITAIS